MVVGASSKATKSATKASTSRAKNSKALPKGSITHPSWKELIKECIVETKSRLGVSRPSIKKYAEEKYKIEMNGLQTSQLNRAIVSGEKLGIFVLPKGPSGKVKLASKVKPVVAKENTEPAAPIKKVVPKAKAVPSKPAAKKAVTKKTATATKKVAKKPTAGRPGKKIAATNAAKAKAKATPKARTRKTTA